MNFTRKKKQQNKRLLSQLDESDVDFMIGQNNHEGQAGSKTIVVDIGSSSINIEGPNQVNSPQVDIHTLEEKIVSKVRCEVDNVGTTVKTRIQHANLIAMENLLFPRVELVMKLAIASLGWRVDGKVLATVKR